MPNQERCTLLHARDLGYYFLAFLVLRRWARPGLEKLTLTLTLIFDHMVIEVSLWFYLFCWKGLVWLKGRVEDETGRLFLGVGGWVGVGLVSI